jgi:hypothetical protein
MLEMPERLRNHELYRSQPGCRLSLRVSLVSHPNGATAGCRSFLLTLYQRRPFLSSFSPFGLPITIRRWQHVNVEKSSRFTRRHSVPTTKPHIRHWRSARQDIPANAKPRGTAWLTAKGTVGIFVSPIYYIRYQLTITPAHYISGRTTSRDTALHADSDPWDRPLLVNRLLGKEICGA